MIFVGDIAIPFRGAINYSDIPNELLKEQWIGNLEGTLLDDQIDTKQKYGVYNNFSAIKDLISQVPFSVFTLANNHILDLAPLNTTTKNLDKLSIKYLGAGNNIIEASKPLVIEESNQKIILLNFGWEVIQCPIATKNRSGVNPMEPEKVLSDFQSAKINYPDRKIICLMHWNYELEGEPQPQERDLARLLIDNGAELIIGAHTHRTGGVEIYKGKTIIYSMGNWLFRQEYYNRGKTTFPKFCNRQLAVQYNPQTSKIILHYFNFDKQNNSLTYEGSEDTSGEINKNLTPFRDLTALDYRSWYKKNHYHKNKGLPIFYIDDGKMKRRLKVYINKFRDLLIRFLR